MLPFAWASWAGAILCRHKRCMSKKWRNAGTLPAIPRQPQQAWTRLANAVAINRWSESTPSLPPVLLTSQRLDRAPSQSSFIAIGPDSRLWRLKRRFSSLKDAALNEAPSRIKAYTASSSCHKWPRATLFEGTLELRHSPWHPPLATPWSSQGSLVVKCIKCMSKTTVKISQVKSRSKTTTKTTTTTTTTITMTTPKQQKQQPQ